MQFKHDMNDQTTDKRTVAIFFPPTKLEKGQQAFFNKLAQVYKLGC